ncbi:MAG: hypothetical protein GX804_11710 [Lentisphaerae bacterium]|jgi:hypothetical protein|nr:hypothetical protein [Lentisphaerota bacterium]
MTEKNNTAATHLASLYGFLMMLTGSFGLLSLFRGKTDGIIWYAAGIILLWAMGVAGVLHAAYRDNDSTSFGKSSDGRIGTSGILVMFPYIFTLWLRQAAISLLSRENRYDKICDGVWIGRRPSCASHLPEEASVCVDLAAEFASAAFLRNSSSEKLKYISFPILEASTRGIEELCECIDSLPEGNIFIHCAQGHGRSGFFTAAYLLRSGRVGTLPQAEELIRSARPGVKLRKAQHAFLAKYEADLKK